MSESVSATLKGMAVGDTVFFPIARYMTVRTQCSTYGIALGRKFACRADRENARVWVSREK